MIAAIATSIIDVRVWVDLAQVIWFSRHENLSKYVILRPSWLIEALRCLLRNNQPPAEDATASAPANGRQSAGQTSRLEKLKTELVKYGM